LNNPRAAQPMHLQALSNCLKMILFFGTTPGMTSFAKKPYSIGCILSETLKEHCSDASRDEATGLENDLYRPRPGCREL